MGEVIVAPGAGSWFFELVTEVTARHVSGVAVSPLVPRLAASVGLARAGPPRSAPPESERDGLRPRQPRDDAGGQRWASSIATPEANGIGRAARGHVPA